ncbi:MAG: acyl-[ACP]--phospholipid O-acyltransferase, partial [Candidatus Brocadiia bacterium]
LTVIFSSGSSGQPKGVMLSHHNVLSNIEALRAVFQLKSSDNLCAILPFFHSFGFTCSLWLPLISGVASVYIANPLDSALIGDTAKQNRSTILFAAPTFLLNYIRRIPAEDFASMRAVVVGAEKLKPQIADSFEQKFKIRPLEGYGSTELSPVVSLNLSDVDAGGMCHKGNKPGTVGHPIPGVAIKVVDPDSMEPLPIGRPGILLVRGPNVMLGYLNDAEKTRQAITDGWYNTGDIVTIDEDGFITITDRLSRFSKIGGEMVPHLRIEDLFHSRLNTSEQVIAVTSIPEPKKGEELVVVYLEGAADPAFLREIASDSRLPNLWKPKRYHYIPVKQMPVLGSGKLDIMTLKKIALNAKNIAHAS